MFKKTRVRVQSSFNNGLQTLGTKCQAIGDKRASDLYDKHRETLEQIYPD